MYYQLFLNSKIPTTDSIPIKAIKALRFATDIGLKESKDRLLDCKYPSLLMTTSYDDEPFDPEEYDRDAALEQIEKIKQLHGELLAMGLDVTLEKDGEKVLTYEHPLDKELNLYLNTFHEEYSAVSQLDRIEDCAFKDAPRSLTFKRFENSPAHPLYALAVQIDKKIYSERIELCSSSNSDYVVNTKLFFMGEDAKKPKIYSDCIAEGCKGVLEKRANSSTGSIYYSCSEWSKGCRIAIDRHGELSEFSKDYAAKLVSKRCPKCARDLMKKTATKGKYAGKQFIGCSGFPDCTYTESIK